jgi:hypothetical protein
VEEVPKDEEEVKEEDAIPNDEEWAAPPKRQEPDESGKFKTA